MQFSEEMLTAYLDNELSKEERALVEKTIGDQPELGELLADLGLVRDAVQALPAIAPTADPVAAVRNRIDLQSPTRAQPPSDAINSIGRWTTFAVAACLLLGIGIYLSQPIEPVGVASNQYDAVDEEALTGRGMGEPPEEKGENAALAEMAPKAASQLALESDVMQPEAIFADAMSDDGMPAEAMAGQRRSLSTGALEDQARSMPQDAMLAPVAPEMAVPQADAFAPPSSVEPSKAAPKAVASAADLGPNRGARMAKGMPPQMSKSSNAQVEGAAVGGGRQSDVDGAEVPAWRSGDGKKKGAPHRYFYADIEPAQSLGRSPEPEPNAGFGGGSLGADSVPGAPEAGQQGADFSLNKPKAKVRRSQATRSGPSQATAPSQAAPAQVPTVTLVIDAKKSAAAIEKIGLILKELKLGPQQPLAGAGVKPVRGVYSAFGLREIGASESAVIGVSTQPSKIRTLLKRLGSTPSIQLKGDREFTQRQRQEGAQRQLLQINIVVE